MIYPQYQFFQFGPIYQPISKAGVGLGLSAIDPFIVNRLKIVVVGGVTLLNLHQILQKMDRKKGKLVHRLKNDRTLRSSSNFRFVIRT